MEWKPCTNLKAVNIQYNAERHFVSATLLRSSNSWYLELSHEKDFYFSRLGTNMARMTWSYGRGPERFCWRYGYCDFLVMVGTKGLISSGKVNSEKLQTILIRNVLKGFIGVEVRSKSFLVRVGIKGVISAQVRSWLKGQPSLIANYSPIFWLSWLMNTYVYKIQVSYWVIRCIYEDNCIKHSCPLVVMVPWFFCLNIRF
jgi:hypothetical protein